VLIQSVSEIALEKVVRIPVPIQTTLPEIPKGLPGLQAASSALKDWVPSDAANIFEVVFQLREYARWLANQYSLARFHQLPARYQVPSEAQLPVPDHYSAELDRQAANEDTPINYRSAYASMRIFRDGSIQHIDAYGNAYTSTATAS